MGSFFKTELTLLPTDRRKSEALANARREIARRLARICSSLSPEEFEKLIDRMALLQWKYDTFPTLAESIDADPLTTAEQAILRPLEP